MKRRLLICLLRLWLEEKEKEKLLAESVENLKKHMIKEGAQSFLQSSEKIGQRETTREKRRMEMLFSKAGLQPPQSESRPKRNKVDSFENESDDDDDPPLSVDEKNVNLQPIFIENISASSESSRGQSHENRTDNVCAIVPNDLIKDSTGENDSQAVKLDFTSTSISTSADNDSNPIAAAFCLLDIVFAGHPIKVHTITASRMEKQIVYNI